jgi:hypothetical protein
MNPTDPTIFTHYCGSEFIRESFIPDAANVVDVLAPSRMNPTDPTIFTHHCGNEFIRESFIPDAANVVDVLAPSRMNPLPHISTLILQPPESTPSSH